MDDSDFEDPVEIDNKEEPTSPGMRRGGVNRIIAICMKKQMDLKNMVNSFEEVGMTDPFKTKESLENTISYVKTFDFFT